MVRLFLLCLLFVASSSAAEWKLVWSDEFDKPGLPDPNKWKYEVGFIRNNEQQYYTQSRLENARVENGKLIIEAKAEHFKNPDFDPARKDSKRARNSKEAAEYTSASITTRGKFDWTYGRLEVRAKLPSGRGTWPAIWMLGSNSSQLGWPAAGEIDIMEFVGFEPNVVHANIHTRKYNHVQKTGKGSQISVPEASTSFHVYALEWFPDRLDFFVDEKKYFTYANEGSGTDAWPYDKPQFLILNLAIGGAWGGAKGIDPSIFPARYEIDYVRIYQKP
jgi:beta-glucanase (GH16 family)